MRPVAVAVAGASPANMFAAWAVKNIRHYNPSAQIWPVNPGRTEVFGFPAYPALADLPARPDCVIITVQRAASVALAKEAVALSVPDIVVVAAGFGEVGDEQGTALDQELRALASASSSRIWGPNGVGFADFHRGICAIAEPVPADLRSGSTAIVSQSGGLLSSMLAGMVREGLGVSWCVSVGNGIAMSLAQSLEYALDQPETRMVCVYMEGVHSESEGRDLQHAFRIARQLGHPVVLLKTGISQRSRRAAKSHTASMAGGDQAFDALAKRHGVIRVDSLDEMIRVATVQSLMRDHPSGGGVAVLGSSGGGAALSSDWAARTGTRLATVSTPTAAKIADLVGPGSFTENPFDFVGTKETNGSAELLEAVIADPGVSLVLLPWSAKWPDASDQEAMHRRTFQLVCDLARDREVPTIIASSASMPRNPWLAEFAAANPHVPVVEDVSLTFRALARVFPGEPTSPGAPESAPDATGDDLMVLDEAEARSVLESVGVPQVRGLVCADADTAERTAGCLSPPYAVKVLGPFSHKARLGGVRLGICDATDVREAVEDIAAAVRAHGIAPDSIRGYLVEEMIFGRELLIGLNRDAGYGDYLVLGLGGVATEIIGRASTIHLPATAGEVDEALGRLDIQDAAVRDCALRLATAFTDGSLAQFSTVEINPLVVTTAGFAAVDALCVRAQPSSRAPDLATANVMTDPADRPRKGPQTHG